MHARIVSGWGRFITQYRLHGSNQGIRICDGPLVEEGAAWWDGSVSAQTGVHVLGEKDQPHMWAGAVQDVPNIQTRGASPQVDVQQGNIGIELREQLTRLAGAAARAHLEAIPRENLSQE